MRDITGEVSDSLHPGIADVGDSKCSSIAHSHLCIVPDWPDLVQILMSRRGVLGSTTVGSGRMSRGEGRGVCGRVLTSAPTREAAARVAALT